MFPTAGGRWRRGCCTAATGSRRRPESKWGSPSQASALSAMRNPGASGVRGAMSNPMSRLSSESASSMSRLDWARSSAPSLAPSVDLSSGGQNLEQEGLRGGDTDGVGGGSDVSAVGVEEGLGLLVGEQVRRAVAGRGRSAPRCRDEALPYPHLCRTPQACFPPPPPRLLLFIWRTPPPGLCLQPGGRRASISGLAGRGDDAVRVQDGAAG